MRMRVNARIARWVAHAFPVLALSAPILAGCNLEQAQIGLIYNFYTSAQRDCPGLNWRFEIDPQRMVSGSLSIDSQPPYAYLAGVLNADDTFRMTATNIADRRTAVLTGRFRARLITVTINGAGTPCDGHTFRFLISGAVGGGGGGGGR